MKKNFKLVSVLSLLFFITACAPSTISVAGVNDYDEGEESINYLFQNESNGGSGNASGSGSSGNNSSYSTASFPGVINPRVAVGIDKVFVQWVNPVDSSYKSTEVMCFDAGGNLVSAKNTTGSALEFTGLTTGLKYIICFQTVSKTGIKSELTSLISDAVNMPSKGDIFYTDGTFIHPDQYTTYVTTAKPIAVYYRTYQGKHIGVGLYRTSKKAYANGSVTLSANNNCDGSGNWALTIAANPTKTEDYFPAYKYCNQYGKVTELNTKDTKYQDKWYLPSYDEVLEMCLYKTTINTSLNRISGANPITWGSDTSYFLSSTYYGSTSVKTCNINYMDMYQKEMNFSETSVCPVLILE